ncbi:hypothetical protein V8E54_008180 [Elaphomyces granulatus]
MSDEDTRFKILLEEDVEHWPTEQREYLVVLVDTIQVNHGTLMEGGSPATLIVMKFQFLPTGNHRRFKVVKAMMKFSKGWSRLDIAPKGAWSFLKSKTPEEISHEVSPLKLAYQWILKQTFLESKTPEEVNHEVSPSIEGGGLKLACKWILKKTKVEENSAVITGVIRALGWDRSKANTAVWMLEENDATKSGIPTLVQTAILLERKQTEETFKATLEVRVETDVCASMRGKVEIDGDVIFNPKINRGAVKNENNLEGEDLEAFVTIGQ